MSHRQIQSNFWLKYCHNFVHVASVYWQKANWKIQPSHWIHWTTLFSVSIVKSTCWCCWTSVAMCPGTSGLQCWTYWSRAPPRCPAGTVPSSQTSWSRPPPWLSVCPLPSAHDRLLFHFLKSWWSDRVLDPLQWIIWGTFSVEADLSCRLAGPSFSASKCLLEEWSPHIQCKSELKDCVLYVFKRKV